MTSVPRFASARTVIGAVGVVASLSVVWVGVGTAEPAHNHPDGGEAPTEPALAEPSRGEIGKAVSVLVRSDEFKALDPRVKGAVVRTAVSDARRLLIEGESRGLTMTVPLSAPVTARGPWTRVDREALAAAAGIDLPHGDHDAVAEAFSGRQVAPDDYSTVSVVSDDVEVSGLWVAIDMTELRVLILTPDMEPPQISWTDAAGTVVSP